jgi:hypothetical protein
MYLQLVIGDTSYDGHNITDSLIIDSNISERELMKAYYLGSEKLGFDLIGQVATDYQNCNISKIFCQELINHGYNKKYLSSNCLSQDKFYDLFLFIVKLGNTDFKYTVVKIPNINIGGYGLFR